MADKRSSTETVTIIPKDAFDVPTATVSSLKSEDSTEHLICKTPSKSVKKLKGKSASSKSVEAGSDEPHRRGSKVLVLLGLGQLVLGALLVSAGALAVVKSAALSRVGAGLWAGSVAVVAGVVGVLAGINDCYATNGDPNGGSPLVTAFLALSLLSIAGGNSAAVLAATGLQRDTARAPTPPTASFQEEMDAWSPVLANMCVLAAAAVQCVIAAAGAWRAARRVCACLRPRAPYDHNTFEPHKPQPVLVDTNKKLSTQLEAKLEPKKKNEPPEYGSANSKEKLVTHWLGRQQGPTSGPNAGVPVGPPTGPPTARRRPHGVRKQRKVPMVLLPAHPASTLGRVPVSVMVPPRYATLPLPPAPYPPPAHLYYPIHDTRMRRRRSPREPRPERRRRETRDSRLTRSLERIHRKRRPDRLSDAELKRTYTGLDRAYAEQFIAVCDESRHAAEHHDSLGSTTTSSAESTQSHEHRNQPHEHRNQTHEHRNQTHDHRNQTHDHRNQSHEREH